MSRSSTKYFGELSERNDPLHDGRCPQNNISCVRKGVPQESPLSPLVFAIYINPLLELVAALPNTMIQDYADDILVYTTSKLAKLKITKHYNYYPEMEKWADQFGIKSAHSETEIMHFPLGEKQQQNLPSSRR